MFIQIPTPKGLKIRPRGPPRMITNGLIYHDLSDCQPLDNCDDNVIHELFGHILLQIPVNVTRYDLAYLTVLPALAPYLLWRRISRGKYTQSSAGMIGRGLREHYQHEALQNGSIWIHAVSVGEITAARAVAPGLKGLTPSLPLVISTITETGQDAAQKYFPADIKTFFPADWSSNVDRFLNTFNPGIFVLMETELWPNFLIRATARGTRCFMINAKLSDRSFPRYRRFRAFLKPALDSLKGICTQTTIDAERFHSLGIPEKKIRVTGNCKLDAGNQSLTPDERLGLFRKYGMNPKRRWIVVGSTHPSEENIMLHALDGVREQFPSAAVLLCPRHPERFDEVAELVKNAGFSLGRVSHGEQNPEVDVILLDQMGSLADAYGLGDIAVVAGSFCDVGGHNLMEAAAHGIPVVFGPRMHNQREILRLFRTVRAGLQVEAGQLTETIIDLFRDESLRQLQSERSLHVIRENRGSAKKAVESIHDWMNCL